MGYINFLPSSLVGPPLEYQDYKQFMENSAQYQHIPTKPLLHVLLVTIGEVLLFGALYAFH
jgi:hypothetical protein